MSDKEDTCYFCERIYKYATHSSIRESDRDRYMYKCQDCARPFCFYETPYGDERDHIPCGNVYPYYGKFKNKEILCGICFIQKSYRKNFWLKVNGKIFESLTGSNTKCANKN